MTSIYFSRSNTNGNSTTESTVDRRQIFPSIASSRGYRNKENNCCPFYGDDGNKVPSVAVSTTSTASTTSSITASISSLHLGEDDFGDDGIRSNTSSTIWNNDCCSYSKEESYCFVPGPPTSTMTDHQALAKEEGKATPSSGDISTGSMPRAEASKPLLPRSLSCPGALMIVPTPRFSLLLEEVDREEDEEGWGYFVDC